MAIYNIGGVRATLFPFNLNGFEEETEMPFATHRPLNSKRVHEKTAEYDEQLAFKGTLYPYKYGGLDEYETLKTLLKDGASFPVMKGNTVLEGLWVLTKLRRVDSFIGKQGVGRKVQVELVLESTSDQTPSGGQDILVRLLDTARGFVVG